MSEPSLTTILEVLGRHSIGRYVRDDGDIDLDISGEDEDYTLELYPPLSAGDVKRRWVVFPPGSGNGPFERSFYRLGKAEDLEGQLRSARRHARNLERLMDALGDIEKAAKA